MKKYENLKQLHENEYARLAIDLHNINEQRKKTLKRMKELEIILATVEHLKPEPEEENV